MATRRQRCAWPVVSLFAALLAGCGTSTPPPDEAKQKHFGEAAVTPTELEEAAQRFYKPASADYFKDMDCVRGGPPRVPLELTGEEIKGRDAWVLWCGGNEAFWDWLARHSYGAIDLLKLIDSQERGKRFAKAGLLSEPGMRAPTAEETQQAHGVRYDRPASNHVERLNHAPNPDYYGYPSGVVGLRLFPNPEFQGAAEAAWKRAHEKDAGRYYNDPEYACRPDTIRPFRVGMSCGFCHIAPHPLNPPTDPEAPQWENLSNNIGGQYLRFRNIFANTAESNNFLAQVLDVQLPGTIDTSLVPSDNINNANTVNSFFGLPARLERAKHNPKETISPDTLAYLRTIDPKVPNPQEVPRVLLDGADSVGVHLALARVYLNIGTYHQQWIHLHNPLLGFRKQQPFKVKDCEENSLFWHATKIRVNPMAQFFMKATGPMHLKDAAEVKQKVKLKGDGETMHVDHQAGRAAFAKGCIACHSSIQPGDDPEIEAQIRAKYDRKGNPKYEREDKLKADNAARELVLPQPEGFQKDWSGLTKEEMEKLLAARQGLRLRMEDLTRLTRGDGALPPGYAQWAKLAVEVPSFWEKNYLSTDVRIPVTLTRTNSQRAMATNGLHGHMWDDYTSETYKELDAVGRVGYRDPLSGADKSYQAPGGGRGYYRVPTLISIWATAPFFHNNALGRFNNDPSLKGRLEAFDDAVARLLWPEKRLRVSKEDLSDYHALHQHLWPKAGSTSEPKRYSQLTDEEKADVVKRVDEQLEADGGLVWRTGQDSWVTIYGNQIPVLVAGLTGWSPFWVALFPWLPSIAFVLLGVALLLGGQGFSYWERLEKRTPLVEYLFEPIRWLLAVAALLLGVAGVIFVWEFWPTLMLLDTGAQGWRFLLRTQALLVPVVFFGSVVVLLLMRFLPAGGFRHRLTQFFGGACLLLAVLTALGFGQFFSGHGHGIRLGPIPEGVPVNLVASTDPDAPLKTRLAAASALIDFFQKYQQAPEGQKPGREAFEEHVGPAFLAASRCPDFVMDRGHDYEFMLQMTDDEKKALIELLKTF